MKYIITVSDIATYEIEANSVGEAKVQAWDWFHERTPAFEVEETTK